MSIIKRSISRSNEAIQGGMSDLKDLGDHYLENSEMSYEDRFGDALGQVRDRAAGESGANRRTIGRALQVGGDVTGAGAVIGNAMQESSNQAVGGVETEFALQNEQINQGNLDRYGNVISDVVATGVANRNYHTGEKNRAEDMAIQKRTAKKQRKAGYIGGALSLAGTLMGSPVAGTIAGAAWNKLSNRGN